MPPKVQAAHTIRKVVDDWMAVTSFVAGGEETCY